MKMHRRWLTGLVILLLLSLLIIIIVVVFFLLADLLVLGFGLLRIFLLLRRFLCLLPLFQFLLILLFDQIYLTVKIFPLLLCCSFSLIYDWGTEAPVFQVTWTNVEMILEV